MNKAWILVALTGSVATAVACSSSSSPAPAANNDDAGSSSGATTDDGGGSSSGATADSGGLMISCKGASDCTTSGDICCGVLQGTSFSSVCQSANCTPILGMPAQGCTTDAECRGTNYTCQSNALLDTVSPGAKVCTPPAASGDGGTTTDSGTSTDAAPVTDAAPEQG
jgi:hypothetical protein